MNKILLFQSLLLAVPFASFGETPRIIFEANKNQWPEQVKYEADIPGGKLFLEQNTFTYLYHENADWHGIYGNESAKLTGIKCHAFKVNFENSNPGAEVSGNNSYAWHRNYYIGNDPKKWAADVPLFS